MLLRLKTHIIHIACDFIVLTNVPEKLILMSLRGILKMSDK